MFSTLCKTNFKFSAKFILSSANAFNFEKSKNLSFGKELHLCVNALDLDMTAFFCGAITGNPLPDDKFWPRPNSKYLHTTNYILLKTLNVSFKE